MDSAIPHNRKSLYGRLQELGFDYLAFGLTSDRACLDPIFFDEQKFNQKQKIYIHCLQSEFFKAIRPIYEKILEEKNTKNWTTFCLDAKHGCMFTNPKELAVIFAGSGILGH